jgi:aminopeptidase
VIDLFDKRAEKLAKLCMEYCVSVKPNEQVVIRGSTLSLPLIGELYKECLLQGANPSYQPSFDLDYIFYKYAQRRQLELVSPLTKFLVETVDVMISVLCDPNPKRLTTIDSTRIREHRAAQKEISEIFDKRYAAGKLRWTVLPYPSSAQAQEAAMPLEEYEDFVYGSCLVDKKDPVAEWKKIYRKQEAICQFLNETSKIRVVGEDTDLTFSTKGRRWVNCGGKINMPDGEVFTGPVENSVNGVIRFTYPGIYSGKEVEDIRLTFNNGKVAKASASKGNELLQELLKIDGADRIGEAAIGTNYGITKFTKEMLFDEKMGGTIHMALGNSYPETGGQNKSAIHWDILKDMNKGGEIYADGKLFYQKGKFLV